MYIYKSRSAEKTRALACSLGKLLSGGELIALEGELGAGKTLFVQGLAQGLGITEPVTSPTFTLLNLYEGRLNLAHFDIYRLPVPEALEEIGYEEYFYGPGVAAVEWSDLVGSYLPENYLQVIIRRDYSKEYGEGRLITLIPHGAEMEMLVEELSVYAGTGD
ncbi:MAG: tRNA (adenosine(37)-N6)-threonylcarbamoyltransferase complex ATPase subunit type 1 TsaE [Clostridia bacterium]|jgi:tRNA threonylcarbamoyladenosine biosynthesis protein TsaE|nr:tRNA (adenosine(37)-N6)-threonylcarbamoyltransferase complex ATPase subunit type 1 TsaE [Clostridia bacterium]